MAEDSDVDVLVVVAGKNRRERLVVGINFHWISHHFVSLVLGDRPEVVAVEVVAEALAEGEAVVVEDGR